MKLTERNRHSAGTYGIFVMKYTDIILSYGRPVLKSRTFETLMTQKHHGCSTAGIHSIRVAYFCLFLASVLGAAGIHADRRILVRAALCHDLGMMERYAQYRSSRQCCFQHPVNSVKEAEKILCDISYKEEDAIRSHMFPLAVYRPHSLEGWILTVADKMAAMTDFAIVFHKPKWLPKYISEPTAA